MIFPFYFPDLQVTIADALRPEHGFHYFPGEVNLRMADIVVISKYSQNEEGAEKIEALVSKLNPKAQTLKADIEISIPEEIEEKEVVVVEDGPTLTHGGMEYGAGMLAAKKAGAKPISPLEYAVGSIKETFEKYPHTKDVLPAMGYGPIQIAELEKTINSMPVELIVLGTPMDISSVISTTKKIVQVTYAYQEEEVQYILDRIYALL